MTPVSAHGVQPYLYFPGTCEEALAFYEEVLGATVQLLLRWDQNPEPLPPGSLPEGFGDKVMHATVCVGNSLLMAADASEEDARHSGFALSLAFGDVPAAERAFEALSEGGVVQMPLQRTFWSPAYGMVADRFGVPWTLNVVEAPPAK